MMKPRVCKNQIVIANYQDQLESRLEQERGPFKEFYDDYSQLLDEFLEMRVDHKEHKMQAGRVFQADHYAMVDIDPEFMAPKNSSVFHSQSFAGNQSIIQNPGGSGSVADRTGTVVRNMKIEEELMQLREQKTELLMTKSSLIEKLVAQQDKNMKLDQENKSTKEKYDKLKEQYDNVMKNLNHSSQEQETQGNQLDQMRQELKIRQEVNDQLTDENKKLKVDCHLMQDRIMEEKSKVIEMMNQANEVYESVSKFGNQSEYQASSKMSILYPPDSGFGQESMIEQSGDDPDAQNMLLNNYQNMEDYDNIPNVVSKKLCVHDNECTAMAFNPMGDVLATAGGDKQIKFWNFKKQMQVGSINLKSTSCCAMQYSLDTELFMQCSLDHRANIHRVRQGYKQVHSFAAHSDLITSCKFIFSMKQAVTASMDSLIRFWDINTGEKVSQISAKARCYDLHMAKSETNFVTGHQDSIKMWNCRTREHLFSLEEAHSHPVSCVRLTNDELYIASISKDSILKIWDVRQRKLVHEFENPKFKIGSNNVKFSISPNSQYVICGTKDGHIFYYDLKKGEVEDMQIKQHKSQVVAVEWQPRSEGQAAMASIDTFGSLLVWSV